MSLLSQGPSRRPSSLTTMMRATTSWLWTDLPRSSRTTSQPLTNAQAWSRCRSHSSRRDRSSVNAQTQFPGPRSTLLVPPPPLACLREANRTSLRARTPPLRAKGCAVWSVRLSPGSTAASRPRCSFNLRCRSTASRWSMALSSPRRRCPSRRRRNAASLPAKARAPVPLRGNVPLFQGVTSMPTTPQAAREVRLAAEAAVPASALRPLAAEAAQRRRTHRGRLEHQPDCQSRAGI